MAARPPPWLIPAGIAAAGAALFWVARTLAAEAGSPIQKQGKIDFWNANQADALRAQLAKTHIADFAKPVERTWQILPGATGGVNNALEQARAIRLRGNVVSVTTNLLEAGNAPRGMAEILVSEFGDPNYATKPGEAILPTV